MKKLEVIAEIKDIEAIVTMLDQCGLTYEEISQKVERSGGKISPKTVSNWFNRKVTTPHLGKVLAVAHAFNMKVLIVR